jgi:hypothetical protein
MEAKWQTVRSRPPFSTLPKAQIANANITACYQTHLVPSHGGLLGISSLLMNAKICFGVLMVTMYAIYLGASLFFSLPCPSKLGR